jgi:hypothetical protein
MCGILGIKKRIGIIDIINGSISDDIKSLLIENSKRGSNIDSSFMNETSTFWHFRTPTVESNLNDMRESYPLFYKDTYLIGNGIINEYFFKRIKDEANKNDLFYILKKVVDEGIQFLEKVEGCFSLCFIKTDGTVLLVRNAFPLYVNNNIFSSTKIGNMELLENGSVYNWKDETVCQMLNFSNNPYFI